MSVTLSFAPGSNVFDLATTTVTNGINMVGIYSSKRPVRHDDNIVGGDFKDRNCSVRM